MRNAGRTGPGCTGSDERPARRARARARAPKGSKAKWVRIKVRVGDTVRKIAKRRGHPEHAAAIVKRNRKVKGKRTIRSRRTKLRHGSGATKATRKKDRRKLWVPAT